MSPSLSVSQSLSLSVSLCVCVCAVLLSLIDQLEYGNTTHFRAIPSTAQKGPLMQNPILARVSSLELFQPVLLESSDELFRNAVGEKR